PLWYPSPTKSDKPVQRLAGRWVGAWTKMVRIGSARTPGGARRLRWFTVAEENRHEAAKPFNTSTPKRAEARAPGPARKGNLSGQRGPDTGLANAVCCVTHLPAPPARAMAAISSGRSARL